MDTGVMRSVAGVAAFAGAVYLLRRRTDKLPRLTNPASEHFHDSYEEARAAFRARAKAAGAELVVLPLELLALETVRLKLLRRLPLLQHRVPLVAFKRVTNELTKE